MNNDLFSERETFPNLTTKAIYDGLVGLDLVKERLEKEAEALIRSDLLEKWSIEKHGGRIQALDLVEKRPPLFIFAGDVGTGKTALASSFGDQLARSTNSTVQFLSLSLRARGSGVVGEMTKLITDAFADVVKGFPAPATGAKPKNVAILLIDEADSLAQTRESTQMHHEDRAGVNAVIRGIDSIASAKIPCLTVMCTNRVDAIDPAVRRRAAAIFEFRRPNLEQRKVLLTKSLNGSGLTEDDIAEIAESLGEGGREYGLTFSDITQKFIPTVVLTAYPHEKISKKLALQVASSISPTPQFQQITKWTKLP